MHLQCVIETTPFLFSHLVLLFVTTNKRVFVYEPSKGTTEVVGGPLRLPYITIA